METDEKFVFDERKHLYYYDGKPMTGCTTILGVLAKPALIPWAAKMATEYVRDNLPKCLMDANGDSKQLTDLIEDMLEEAKNAHRKKKEDAAEAGTDTHALVETWIRAVIDINDGIPSSVGGTAVGFAPEIQPFVEWAIKENITFKATEQKLYSKKLFVAGTVDFVFEKKGKRYVGDLKTYKKLWDRVPLIQCAGYSIMWSEMYGEEIDGYCVVCLPKERKFNESEDVMWSFDPQGEKEAFISCVNLYRYLNQ